MDHSMHNMNNMSTTSSNSQMHHMMHMGTFHWGTTGDGVWINTWVPYSKGAYAGVCFGIFFMSILSRGLPALEGYLTTLKKPQVTKAFRSQLNPASQEDKRDIEILSGFAPYTSPPLLPSVPPFSWKYESFRSILSAFCTFISYLLMMAVMTGNAGYLFVIIGGVFAGETAFGRYKCLKGVQDEHDH